MEFDPSEYIYIEKTKQIVIQISLREILDD